ncbi:hypothetical protein Hanom_Chr13g01207211 [Helianthus anomalus]
MSYEGSYPLTTKKLLHPYWRFLAHVYLICISGNKSGIDALTIRQTSGVGSLIEGWKFNYSKCVFDNMMENVKTLNKKYWKMFDHMVFSVLNQVRRDVQVLYQNKKALVKLGAFLEIAEQVQAPVNAATVENVDLTGIERKEENVFQEMLMDTTEFNEKFGEIEAEINVESLSTDKPIEDQTLSVNPPNTETIESINVEPENVTEDPTADLHPRKRSR